VEQLSSDESTKAAGRVNAVRIEAARAQGLAEGQTQVDVATFIEWVTARRFRVRNDWRQLDQPVAVLSFHGRDRPGRCPVLQGALGYAQMVGALLQRD
jgi:hypothetical protein